MYTNPIIPGFYPDPSICRVGQDYYLVTSSFVYFPGVPVFHSRDLVHWRQIGHCLTRPEQLPLSDESNFGGIYAPTLRYHRGRFYMITTNVPNYGHFYVWADDPAGEWSDPIRVEGSGFDPDLFFDEDGKVYMSRHADDHDGIRLWQIDLESGRLIGPEHKIWPGFEDDLCEAPHIYKINGWYTLLVAEGGTHRGHMACMGRSRQVTGPYESCPHNPILSHRARVAEPIQATGHGDLMQAHDGSWWMVFLGIRQIGWRYHHLGRETFQAPVSWTADGWPLVYGGKPICLQMDVPTLPLHPWPEPPERDDFDAPRLGLCWNFRKPPVPRSWSLSERPGWLTLRGSPLGLDDPGAPAFVGQRQRHFDCVATALLEFAPQAEGEEAGLAAYMDENHHYEITLRRQDGSNRILVRKRIGDLSVVAASVPCEASRVLLRIQASEARYTLAYAGPDGVFHPMADALPRYLSSEVAGGFTGVYFAMYAASAGKSPATPAYFDWFEYRGCTPDE